MIEFVSGCAGLFTSTFNAANSQPYFQFLSGYVVIQVGFGVFCMLSKGARKL